MHVIDLYSPRGIGGSVDGCKVVLVNLRPTDDLRHSVYSLETKQDYVKRAAPAKTNNS